MTPSRASLSVCSLCTLFTSLVLGSYTDFQRDEMLTESTAGCHYIYQWWRIASRNNDAILKLHESQHCTKYGMQLINIPQFNRMSRLLEFTSTFRTVYLAEEVVGKVMLVNILPTQESKFEFTVDLLPAGGTLRSVHPPPSHFICVAVQCATERPSTTPPTTSRAPSTTASSAATTFSIPRTRQHTLTATATTSTILPAALTSEEKLLWKNWTIFIFLVCCSVFVIFLVLTILILVCRVAAFRRTIRQHKETIDYLSTIKRPQASNGNIDRRRNLLNTQRSVSSSTGSRTLSPLSAPTAPRWDAANSPSRYDDHRTTARLISLREISPTSTSTVNISGHGVP